MISLRGGMLDDKVIYYYLGLLCLNVSDIKCTTTDPLKQENESLSSKVLNVVQFLGCT